MCLIFALLVYVMYFINFSQKFGQIDLKKFLTSIITEHQSTFAKDWLITDNILIAFETLHCMKNYSSGSLGYMALKLDMSKAYNRMEWIFLKQLMRKMGLCDRWIDLVMVCV